MVRTEQGREKDNWAKGAGLESSVGELVARHRRGDPSATEALVVRALRSALRTAAATLGTRDEASDVAQDVAIEVLRGIHLLRDPSRFDAWVHRIVVRRTARYLKRRRRARLSELPLLTVSDEAVELTAPNGPELAVERLAIRLAVREALAELPARQRIALALRYVHDLSDAEIADALGCRRGTADSLLSRGRALLRENISLADFESALGEGTTR